jgi:basic membrane protein A
MDQKSSNFRRRCLAGFAACAVATAAFALPQTARADESQVAGLFSSSVTQGNWDPAGYQAFIAMAKKYHLKSTYVENASDEQAPALLRSLATGGAKLIICHSSGYAAAVQEVAPEFPKTHFVVYSYADSTHGLANYSAWSMNWDEYGYIIGVLAAASSKSHHIAIIAGAQIPSIKRSVDFMTKGAKSIDPSITVDAVYIGSFTDVAKAKEIATDEIARGADFLIPSADSADAGVQQAADEQGALTMGEYIDESKDYPASIVSSTVLNYKKAYAEIGEKFTTNTLQSVVYGMDLAHGDWTLSRPFKHVDPSVETKVFAVISQIEQNKIDIEK